MDLFSLKLELPVDILDIGTILEYLSLYTCVHIAYIKISFHQIYLFMTIVNTLVFSYNSHTVRINPFGVDIAVAITFYRDIQNVSEN